MQWKGEFAEMILERLGAMSHFSASEEAVIRFIQKYPKVTTNLSLEQLAKECSVSQATVIRLCKKLGAKGFAEFKVSLASELGAFALENREVPVDIPLPSGAEGRDIARTFYTLSRQALDRALNELDYDAIHKAAVMLARANIIHVFGRGESLVLAADFHYKLLRLGKNSTLETMNGFQEMSCRAAESHGSEVALLISHYCNSHQVTYFVDELMNCHIPFILLTAAQKPWPYDLYAAVTLRISSVENRHKMGSFASRTAFLLVLDCLFGEIFSLDYEKNRRNLEIFSQRTAEREYFYKTELQDEPL